MKPIAYASRSLNPAEKRYSQLDKEGLAIVFGVKKFHHYLFEEHSHYLFQSQAPSASLLSITSYSTIGFSLNSTLGFDPERI